ncbi:hypothetical protein [Kitasatospora sp. NPDC004272]
MEFIAITEEPGNPLVVPTSTPRASTSLATGPELWDSMKTTAAVS